MSLLDALLLDPLRMNVWIAARADGVAGTGTQNDPLDGSTAAKLDALMNAMPVPITSIIYSGNGVTGTATVTAINHPFATDSSVLIAGVTNSSLYNGTFTITVLSANTFTYPVSGGPPPSPAQGPNMSCRPSTYNGPVVPLPIVPPIAVHLGPGTFQTNGYADGVSGGWQPRPGMRIVGSGIDVTVLQLAGSSANAHFYAIGHVISPGTSPNAMPNLLDYFEVSDLTIDSHLAAYTGATAACGAVRVMGDHARIRRLKLINWGTKATTRPCFVVSAVAASDLAWVEDCGIEECIAIDPAGANTGPATVFHAGGTDAPPAVPLALGVAPYLRNCFVDAGQSPPSSTTIIRGLSMAWCKAGIIEGNQAHNLTYGTFQQATTAQDLVIRNNWFKNVNKGILLGGLDGVTRSGSLSRSGTTVTVTVSTGPNVSVGDIVLINTSPTSPFDGLVATVTGVSGSTFTFSTSITSASSATVSSVQKVFGVSNLTVEGNVVELAASTSGVLIGIHVQDGSLGTNPQDTNPAYATYVFGKVILRDNRLRYLDGAINGGFVGYPIQANSASNLLVRNNVVESDPANPIRNDRCQSVAYFNNQKPDGTLVQGYNADTGKSYEELATIADFALVMGLFNRKS